MMRPKVTHAVLAGLKGLLMLLGVLLGLMLAEAGYRVYLSRTYPDRFTLPHRGDYFAAYNVSHWEFDPDFGYVYPAGRVIDHVGVRNGVVESCDRIRAINGQGNIGPAVEDYSEADLKVLVFGDSYTAFHQADEQGRDTTWPSALQERLEARLGRRVRIVNFGRDGYGVLQMFDLAAAKIPEWKPDVAVIAFITDDLARARFWRAVVGRGDAMRVLTTTEATPTPDPIRSADTYLLLPSATSEWCVRMRGVQRRDGVLRSLIRKHRQVVANNGGEALLIADAFTLRHSYIYHKLADGNVFAFLWRRLPPATNPRLPTGSFANDGRLQAAIERINHLGIPYMLFHLATAEEIGAGREYVLDRQQASLLESLRTVTGRPIVRLTDYVRLPVAKPQRIGSAENDSHPSLWGMRFYAEAVGEAVMRALPTLSGKASSR
jgi:hypothetical protein